MDHISVQRECTVSFQADANHSMKQVEHGIDQVPTNDDDDSSFVRTCLLARSPRLKLLWLVSLGVLAIVTQEVLVSKQLLLSISLHRTAPPCHVHA